MREHKTSTAKQVLGNCERMVLANLLGNRLWTFILWIWLSTCTLYMLWPFFWRLPKLGNEFKSIFACCQVSNVASGGSLWGGWRFYFVSRKLSSVKPFRNSQRQALICSLVLAWCPRTLAHGAPFPGFSCKSLTVLSLSRKIISPIHISSQNFRMSILWLPSLT